MPGFHITGKKGFHITFENGYTVSVQFGPGNYCDHYDRQIGAEEEVCGREGSSTAECAIWSGSDGELIELRDHDIDLEYGVSNRSTPADVLRMLVWAAAQPAKERN